MKAISNRRSLVLVPLVVFGLAITAHTGLVTPPVVRAVEKYGLDASQSRFIVRAFVGGLLSGFGHDHTIAIRDFTGEIELTQGSLEPASLHMTIKADSLTVIDKVKEKDRREIENTMRTEVLETAKYPEIVFRSTRVEALKTGEGTYSAKIWGELQLHGVTRAGLINAQLQFGGNTIRARGEFPLKQTDYNIKPVSVAAGTIKVKDELKFSFDMVAVKK